ncbi:MAG: MBL fold metallo-hydrolase [Myxococcota bacterium]
MPDRITVIGSSDAFNGAGRCHSCYLVEGDGCGPIMIDFGATSLLALRRAGRKPTDIAALAVTHLHGDHVGGFPFLLIDGMFKSVRTAPLPILGPTGVAQRLEGVARLAYGDLVDRDKPFSISIEELLPGERGRLSGAEVEAFAAEHMDLPDRPLCLRFRLPSGKVVAFSGDTMMCEGLRAAAAGADLLVAECTGLAPPVGRHCTWQDWEPALPTIGAKRVVLSHLSQAVRDRAPELLRRAPPECDLTFADDGMIFDL